jgi:hypothetical protein
MTARALSITKPLQSKERLEFAGARYKKIKGVHLRSIRH